MRFKKHQGEPLKHYFPILASTVVTVYKKSSVFHAEYVTCMY